MWRVELQTSHLVDTLAISNHSEESPATFASHSVESSGTNVEIFATS